MQLLHDFYLIAVDQVFESNVTPAGIITSATAIIDENQEDRGKYKRRYGTVLECPVAFSDLVVDYIDSGVPRYKKYVSHDWIVYMNSLGYDHYNSNQKYYPSTYEGDPQIKLSDIAKRVDVVKGERVYFREESTDPERFMGMYEGKRMYSVRVDEIICSIRTITPFQGYNGYKQQRIVMQGNWALLQPNMETWEDITIPLPGKPKEEWLVTKVAPGAKWSVEVDEDSGKQNWKMTTEGLPLEGTIKSIRHRDDIKDGDQVLFMRDADAPITVEGKEYTCMYHDEILVKIKR